MEKDTVESDKTQLYRERTDIFNIDGCHCGKHDKGARYHTTVYADESILIVQFYDKVG
jgi:hypothetical protein